MTLDEFKKSIGPLEWPVRGCNCGAPDCVGWKAAIDVPVGSRMFYGVWHAGKMMPMSEWCLHPMTSGEAMARERVA